MVARVGGPSSTLPDVVALAADEIAGLLPDLFGGERSTVEMIPPATTTIGAGSLQSAGVIYTHTQTPGWAPRSTFEDVRHHLAIVCRRGRTVAIYTSESTLGRRVSQVFGSADHPGFDRLTSISPARLNGAFLAGETRTVWMSGLHRRTAHKADSKVLAGSDLRAAFEPLGDQTYRFTAARGATSLTSIATRANPNVVVGVSAGKSRIWAGPSTSWEDFAAVMWRLLGAIDGADDLADPLPVLAQLATGVADLESPYDVSVVDPILLAPEEHADEQLRLEAEKWADRAIFEVGAVRSPTSFDIDVTLDEVGIGALRMDLSVEPDGTADIEVTLPPTPEPELEGAAKAARRRDWLAVRFESGHTVTGGSVYCTRFRDRPFTSWSWENFTHAGRDFDVKVEKPNAPDSTRFDPDAIGVLGERSLFSWTFHHWPDQNGVTGTGWLASDDGSGEIADFIHLDETVGPPLLSLIHVKGSKSRSPARSISTSDYEVVVGQAVKNLRFLDVRHLADQLHNGRDKAVARANWQNGVRQDAQRAGLVAKFRTLGSNLRLRVVILQPRVTKADHDAVRDDEANGNETSRLRRMRQLDALLLEAEAACRQMNADMIVVGDRQGLA